MNYCSITGRKCKDDECIWWDKQRKQCLYKLLMQALVVKLPVSQVQWSKENPTSSILNNFGYCPKDLKF